MIVHHIYLADIIYNYNNNFVMQFHISHTKCDYIKNFYL